MPSKKSNSHNLILNKAARDVLRLLGMFQKGKSRSWIDDHGWWLGFVEFQPSSWSKGSYLNVGPMFLTYPKDFFSFSHSYRKESHIEYETDEQFTPKAAWLARRASEEIKLLRDKYPDLKRAAEVLVEEIKEDPWRCYYAATLCGLAGMKEVAQGLFERVVFDPDDRDWAIKRKEITTRLIVSLDDPKKYKAKMVEFIKETRTALKLPKVDIVFR
jgi:hypothetical protein